MTRTRSRDSEAEPSPVETSRRTQAGRNVGLLIAASIASCCVVEVGVRQLFPAASDDEAFWGRMTYHVLNSPVVASDARVHMNAAHDSHDDEFGFVLDPGRETHFASDEFSYVVNTNDQGLRTAEFTPGGGGVVLLGDSMLFGIGAAAQQTVEAEMKRLLKERLGAAVPVHTLAVPGYNTVQQLQLMRAYGELLQPDFTVLGLFVANDVLPNHLAKVTADGTYRQDAARRAEIEGTIKARLAVFEHSVALRVMLGPVMAPRIRYELSRRKEILDSTLRHVDLISMEAANVGSDFAVLVIYPADGLAGGILQWWSRSRETGKAILENCTAREWRCLDQLDFMEGRADRRKYYWAVDKHPNPEGNRRIAEGVVDFLFDGAPRTGR